MDNLEIYKTIFTGKYKDIKTDIHDLTCSINKYYEFKVVKYSSKGNIYVYLFTENGYCNGPKYTVRNTILTEHEFEYMLKSYIRSFTIDKLLEN